MDRKECTYHSNRVDQDIIFDVVDAIRRETQNRHGHYNLRNVRHEGRETHVSLLWSISFHLENCHCQSDVLLSVSRTVVAKQKNLRIG